MMRTQLTDFGRFIVGPRDELFAEAARIGSAACAKPDSSWALTGGSTPLEWYRWVTATGALAPQLAATTHFTVSDERFVPLGDKQSNFGNATSLLFDPLGIPAAHRHPWPVHLPREAAASAYAESWAARFGAGRAYEVCFLGMGDDAHTASWFPGSPLLAEDGGRLFDGIDVPGKGFRLTITPTGLRSCGQVVVMTLGAAKAPALRRVLSEAYNPSALPSQILRTLAPKVTWLVDEAAGEALG
ncbi:6-phosphogluconolactonase [Nibricoccus sp. IMCC34717]|uniref:6-phosphogluconolactonase n=1 Tax=Nibricoccus sp. IMCC34717 TaxID=3034021 RepID=UPI00384F0BC8